MSEPDPEVGSPISCWDFIVGNEGVSIEGCHPIECAENGLNYVWTGQHEHTSVIFKADLCKVPALEISIIAISAVNDSAWQGLKVFFNGSPLNQTRSTRTNEGYIIRGTVTQSAIRATECDFHVVEFAGSRGQLEIQDSVRQDERLLGIALHQVRLRKIDAYWDEDVQSDDNSAECHSLTGSVAAPAPHTPEVDCNSIEHQVAEVRKELEAISHVRDILGGLSLRLEHLERKVAELDTGNNMP